MCSPNVSAPKARMIEMQLLTIVSKEARIVRVIFKDGKALKTDPRCKRTNLKTQEH
jgi:hypothetical protein